MTTPTARADGGPAAGRGGKINRDAVLATALEIIDRDGADALSMRRLARALDRDPMILYRHAPSKAALLDGVAETVLAQLQVDSADPDWAGQLREVARRLRRHRRTRTRPRHPAHRAHHHPDPARPNPPARASTAPRRLTRPRGGFIAEQVTEPPSQDKFRPTTEHVRARRAQSPRTGVVCDARQAGGWSGNSSSP